MLDFTFSPFSSLYFNTFSLFGSAKYARFHRYLALPLLICCSQCLSVVAIGSLLIKDDIKATIVSASTEVRMLRFGLSLKNLQFILFCFGFRALVQCTSYRHERAHTRGFLVFLIYLSDEAGGERNEWL